MTTIDAAPQLLAHYISLDDITVQHNPRKSFDDDAIIELSNSIRMLGVLQAITVRPAELDEDGAYVLVDGERRFRAAKLAELTEIPAFVKTIDPGQNQLRAALTANLHRSDLNPVELAETFHELSSKYGMEQQEIAALLPGKRDPSYVSNHVRLLGLPQAVLTLVRAGKLTWSHAIELVPIAHLACQCAQEAELAVVSGFSVATMRARIKGVLEEEKAKIGQTAIEAPEAIAPSIPVIDGNVEESEDQDGQDEHTDSDNDEADPADEESSDGVDEDGDDTESEQPVETDADLISKAKAIVEESKIPKPSNVVPTVAVGPAVRPAAAPIAPPTSAAKASVMAMITNEQDDWLFESGIGSVRQAIDLLKDQFPYLLSEVSKLAAQALTNHYNQAQEGGAPYTITDIVEVALVSRAEVLIPGWTLSSAMTPTASSDDTKETNTNE